VIFDFRANAFLHHMVRNIVGSLIYVGKGKHPPEWLASVLASRTRARAAPTFEAAGLYLVEVEYERGWGLPSAPPATLMAQLQVLNHERDQGQEVS
jgi:tRNA pseudouridine38-40 synthase